MAALGLERRGGVGGLHLGGGGRWVGCVPGRLPGGMLGLGRRGGGHGGAQGGAAVLREGELTRVDLRLLEIGLGGAGARVSLRLLGAKGFELGEVKAAAGRGRTNLDLAHSVELCKARPERVSSRTRPAWEPVC
eukprot:scaffold38563_cov39-Phaeocystis_antarctica.AAC.1